MLDKKKTKVRAGGPGAMEFMKSEDSQEGNSETKAKVLRII